MKHFPDRSTMQAPGVCFICETSPQAGYVDTLHNFTPGFPHALAGAITICDNCVKSAAEAAGFYADDTVKESAKVARIAEGKFTHVVSHVQEVVKALEESVLHDVASQAPIVVAEASAEVDAIEAAAKPKKAKAVKAEATDAPADAEPAA